MQYKGYTGVATIDPEAGVIHGTVANLRAVVTFQGESVREAERAFRDSVDDYLDYCVERGVDPEKPFSGKFLVRIAPDLHRDLATEAARAGTSLNELVGQILARRDGEAEVVHLTDRQKATLKKVRTQGQAVPAPKAGRPRPRAKVGDKAPAN
jgi:predicted HicB family RNase H-like nuclease